MRFAALLLALLVAGPAMGATPTKGKAAAPKGASAADLAEQMAMLAFDANPLWGVPARERLSRWVGPMRMLVFGKPEDGADAKAALAQLGRASGLSLRVVAGRELARAAPNAFLVVDPELGAAFAGPFREMLRQAFLDDERETEAFIAEVASQEPCWALPVWADPGRTVLKAGVIGVNPTGGREAVRACLVRAGGGLLGLLGPGAFLPGSAFLPAGAARLGRDDERMLRAMYGRGLRPGMDRAAAQAAAARALGPPARTKGKKTP